MRSALPYTRYTNIRRLSLPVPILRCVFCIVLLLRIILNTSARAGLSEPSQRYRSADSKEVAIIKISGQIESKE